MFVELVYDKRNFDGLEEGKTPSTFHEQRSLAERLYEVQGINTKELLDINHRDKLIAIMTTAAKTGSLLLFRRI